MRFSDHLNIAVATMLTAAAILVSSVAGPNAARWTSGALFLTSAIFFAWLALSGPKEVSVRFGDMDQFTGALDRIFIRRTVNRFYVFLKTLDLDPPRVCPIINIAMMENGLQCTCTEVGSDRPNYSAIGARSIRDRVIISQAYFWCYVHKHLSRGTPDLSEEFKYTATWLLVDYFSLAFTDTPFVFQYRRGNKWASTLLSIRLECGKDFTDGAMAHVFLSLPTGAPINNNEFHETFNAWFHRWFYVGMFTMSSQLDRGKMDRAAEIIKERGIDIR